MTAFGNRAFAVDDVNDAGFDIVLLIFSKNLLKGQIMMMVRTMNWSSFIFSRIDYATNPKKEGVIIFQGVSRIF